MRSNPLQVGSGFYRSLALGNNSTMAIDPYGTLSAWGENLYGQAGTNSITSYSWTQLSNGDAHSLALRSDNTLWAWGLNSSGQLGVGDTVARQSPTQINAKIDGVTTLTWSQVSAGASHSVALTSDNVAYGWGLNTSGQVGDVTVGSRSAPVQIGVAGTPANYSANFSGVSGTYLSVADNVALQFGTGTFTVELWFYATVQSSEYLISRSTTSPLNDGWGIQKLSGSFVIRVQIGGTAYNTGFTYKLNTWQHIAFTRDSNNDVRFFSNGVSSGIIVNTSYNLSEAVPTIIGAYAGSSTSPYTGYISNLRILKGTALYTTNFTPSVSPFSNIANTVLLTCHTSNLADGSSNNFTITNNGGVTFSTVNPFVYYSGSFVAVSSQALTLGGQTQFAFGTGDFTIECFVYATSTPSGLRIIDFTPSGGSGSYPAIIMRQFFWQYEVNGVAVISVSASPAPFVWYHVALVRVSGITKLYINGDQIGSSYIDTNNYIVGASRPVIGSAGFTLGSEMMNGYISNLRVVKGVGVYTSNFTIPTNILRTVQAAGTNITALSGTETVLLTLQDSTFIDKSNNNFTITILNGTTISSTAAPFQPSVPAGGTGTLIASKISAGKDFTLAIKSDNTLWSWGLNTSYQLGSGITVPRSSPVQVGTNSWSQISAGGSHALAIDSNNLLYGWGNNSSGQVGVKVFSWTQVAGSTGTGFAIRDDGSLWSWGLNSWGQLGQNDIIHRSSPVAIGTDSWLQVSSGSLYVLAIRSDNTLWSWGYNNVGQLGLDSIAPRSSPVQVGTSSWSSVSAGTNSSLGIKTDTTLWAWGSNGTGQLGIGLTTSRSSPVQVSSAVTTWSVISISESIAAAISTSGGLYLWGLALANGTSVNRSSPVQLGTESWSAVATGLSSAIGIDTLGRLYSWGTNTNHQLGDNSALTVSRSSPVQLGASSWSIVSAGTSSSFAITTDSRLFAWGLNSSNQLGDGTAEPRSSPVQIGAGINFTKISSGSTNNSYAIDNDYYLYSWGNGNNGAIGDSTVATKIIPTQVGGVNNNTIFIKPFKIGESSWSAVSAGYSHSVALTSDNRLFTWGNNTNGQLGFTASFISVNAGNLITSVVRSDGTLWTWGFNNSGQLGNGTVILRSGPIQVGLLNNWSKTTKPSLTNYAINNTGKLYAWGENSIGSIGDNTTVSKSSPVQIGTSSWTMVVTSLIGGSGQQTTYAIRNDGILFAWGNSANGGLANNLGAGQHSSSPIQIGSSSYSLVSAGSNFVLALASDNRLFAWGDNTNGQLGVTPTTYSWSLISTGLNHTLAVRSDNKLFTWGFNQYGELGDNTTVAKSSPIFIYSGSFVSVAAGYETSAFVTSDGKLFTWGINLVGQLGDPTISPSTHRSFPTQISTDQSYTQVYTGVNADGNNGVVFAKRSDSTLWAWGSNSRLMIGDNTTVNKSSPTQVSVGSSWNTVSVGLYHVLAIDSNNKLYTWGDITLADNGQFGPAVTFSWSSISSGAFHTLAIRSDGRLFAWGFNAFGQLGDATTVNKSSPIQVGAGNSFTAIAANFYNSYAIRTDGKLFTWGAGTGLGDGTSVSKSVPTQVGVDNWSKIFSGGQSNSAFGLRSNNTLYAWGSNLKYQLGDGTSTSKSSPVQVGTSSWSVVSIGTDHTLGITIDNKLFVWGNSQNTYFGQLGIILPFSWSKINSGGNHTLAIRSDNMLFGWGDNSVGQLGIGDTAYRSSPVQIGTSSWSQISSGLTFSLAIRSDGALFTWGYNTSGQLGDPTAPVPAGNGRSSPVQVGTSSWSQVVANKFVNSAFGLLIDNTLYAWGQNTNYTLGDGTSINRSSPVQIGTSSWISVASGTSHTLAIRSDNKLFVWGNSLNSYFGQLGSVLPFSWSKINSGSAHTLAIRSDNMLFSWGYNLWGQLGTSDTTNRSSPVQIGTSSWTNISAGLSNSFAIRSDGGLFVWGANAIDIGGRSSPVQIGTSSWSQVAASKNSYFGFAITSNNTLYAWGSNNFYQLGDSTTIYRSSLVQIGTSSWISVSAGTSHSLGITTDNKLFIWGSNSTTNLGLTGGAAPFSWSKINSGSVHTLAIRSDGMLFAWGSNSSGRLGTGDTLNRSSPVQIGTSSWTQIGISAGATSMAIRSDGGLFTWGQNQSGQLGDPTASSIGRSSPVQVGTSSWSQIFSSRHITNVFGTLSDNTLYAWGYNANYQLGDGTTIYRSSPVQIGTSSWIAVSGGTYHTLGITTNNRLFVWGDNTITNGITGGAAPFSWSKISSGRFHTLAIRSDNMLFGWGNNQFGQLGLGNLANRSSPTQIGTSSWSQISAGLSTSYAVRSDGGLFSWGDNTKGQLGDLTGSTAGRSSPVQVGTSSWSQINSSQTLNYVLAITTDGKLFGWGDTIYGAIGRYSLQTVPSLGLSSPVQVGTSSWSVVSAGGGHTLGIDITNKLYAWGYNNIGQLGTTPTAFSWTQITAGRAATLTATFGIRSDGALFAWGASTSGQLGLTSLTTRSSPVQVGNSSWTQVAVGENNNVYAIRNDGSLFVWGSNVSGQLGTGDTLNRSSPVQIGTSSWSVVRAGASFAAAITTDGKLFTWGNNTRGKLGDFSPTVESGNRSSPAQVGTSSWTGIACGTNHMLAIGLDGTLWTWGGNDGGQLGLDLPTTTGNRSQPVQIDAGSWSMVEAAASNSYAIKSGQLFGWGINGAGNVGDGTTIGRSSPVQISAGTSFSVVSASFRGQLALHAISTTGGLFAWCANNNGQLGLGDTLNRSAPVQVGALTTWSRLGGGFGINNTWQLYGWGFNTDGQIGLLDVIPRSSPVQIGTNVDIINYAPLQVGESSWTSVSAGSSHSTAIRTDGGLFTWGLNNIGQLGLTNINAAGDTVNRSSPVQVGTSSWTSVSAGASHSMALRYLDGALFTWGLGNPGQLGSGATASRSSPVQVGTSSYNQISAGASTGVGVDTSGFLYTWGLGTNGQLGDNTIISKSTPTYIFPNYQLILSNPVQLGTSSWTSVSAGNLHSLALRIDGALFAWGENSGGNLGLTNINATGDTVNRSSPVQVGSSSWSIIFAGSQTSGAIRSDGALFTWGINGSGQLGSGGIASRSSPVQVGTSSWTAINIPTTTGTGLDISGNLYAWGLNDNGQIGDNTTVNKGNQLTQSTPNYQLILSNPVQLGTSSWTSVSAGNLHSLALRIDGALFAWGAGTSGQLGLGDTTSRSSPTQVGTSSWSQISAGDAYSHAMRSDGGLFTWGSNIQGVLGLGDSTTINRSSPTQIGTSSYSQISTGYYNSSSIDISGNLYTWAYNLNGQLGDNTTIARSSPVQITPNSQKTVSSPTQIGTSDFLQVAVGIDSSYAIRTDGALFAWGLNDTGQLGVGVGGGDTVNRSSPVQIGTSSWSAIGAGGSHAIALRSDGAVFTWGANTLGVVQLGLGDGVARSSPVQVGTSSWSAITADNNGGFVLNNLGFLWGWGNNNLGQLGLNFIGSQSIPQNVGPNLQTILSSPVQIGTSSWLTVAAGEYFSLAIRSDNLLFTWGINNAGQLGLGDRANRSSPTQVGVSSWAAVSAGLSHSMALRSNDNALFTWGYNPYGASGLGDTFNRSSPVQVGNSSYTFISSNTFTNVVIDKFGYLYTMGSGGNGELGDSTTVHKSTPTLIGPYYSKLISSPVQIGTSSWLSVAAGENHSLAISSNNTLYAWGLNTSGQLGNGTIISRSSITQIGTSSWISVSAGSSQTVALRSDGALFTWGFNSIGQLGLNDIVSRSSPVQIGSSSYTLINAGRNTAFGLNINGILSGWGQNNQGQVGDGGVTAKSTPTALRNTSTIEYSPLQVGSSSWSTVSAGGSHAVGIKIDNTVFAWGLNNAGQLGDITVVSRSSPVQVGTVTNALTNANAYSLYYDSGISGSRNMTTSTSSDWALGANWTIEFFLYLTTYPSSADVKWIIYQGGTPGIRIFIDYNPLGTFHFQADGSTVRFGTANSVPLLSWIHVAVVSTSGTAVVYFNGIAQSLSLNQGNGGYNLTATDGITLFNRPSGGTTQTNFNGYISNLRIVKGTSVYTSNFTTPANPLTAITNTVLLMAQNTTITTDNSGTSKVLTVNGTAPTYSLNTPFPSAIAGGAIFATQVNAGSSHSALIDTSNRLYTWGLNNAGQLGLGDTLARSAPTQIAINNIYKNITLGADHTIAIDFTDTLYAWGAGVYGQQGLGDTLYRSRPTQISSISLPNVSSPMQIGTSSYTSVSAGNNTSIALSSNNKLFAWGLGTTGQLGTGVTFSRSSPVQLSANSYNLISAGGTHTTFVPTISPQIILATGLGTSGQIGDITIISKSSPTQIGASNTKFNSPVTVSTGNYSSYYVSSPTQVGTSSWTSVSAGGTHTLGIKKDNTLYAWGYNANGQLGGSSTINRSSPVQVGTSSWSQVSAGDSHNVIAKSDGTINTFGLNTFGQLGDGT